MSKLSPVEVNLTLCSGLAIYKGADWTVPITVSERVNLKDTPVDLTGLVGKCAIKCHAGDDSPIAMPRVEITDAKNGQFELYLPAEETIRFITEGDTWKDVSEYQYDVVFENTTNGETYRTLQGFIEVSPSVVDGND